MPLPDTVTLADPVPAVFADRPMLSTTRSVDTATDKLPARCPTLDTTRMLPLAPEAVRHRADVSDIHAVCSHAVRPDRAAPLHAPSPSPRPDTVALIDPVDAALLAASTLAPPTSPETAAVRLPTLPPTLTDTRTLPPTLDPPAQRTDVSEAQAVAEPALAPIRPDSVYPASPSLAPCTVTLELPVDSALARCPLLTTISSVENPALMLPASRPELIATTRLPSIPAPAPHRTELSDPHDVRSQAVPAPRREAVSCTIPRPEPNKVTLADPVVPTFSIRPTLISPTSPDIAAVMLPNLPPPLTKARRLPPTLAPPRHRTDVSDAHAVAEPVLDPIRPDSEYPTSPSPAPCSVTLAPPVAPALVLRPTLIASTSAEYPELMLPARPLALTTIIRLPIGADPTSHVTDVSDSHTVCSQLDPPDRPAPVYPAKPSPRPTTVRLDEPVDAAFIDSPALICLMSADHSMLTLFAWPPTLMASSRLTRTPAPVWHSAEVSDSHIVCSHLVPPVRPAPLKSASPTPPPYTLTRADPVEPVFALRATDAAAPSTEKDTLKLPTDPPVLTENRWLLIAAPEADTTRLVSDSHLVPSHAVAVARDDPVSDESPIRPPCTVTLADPVPIRFPVCTRLSVALSVDTATDKLPARRPTLDTTRVLPLAPDPARHRADVSDIHPVCSHAVRPDRAAPLPAASPSPRPENVTLIDPVDAVLLAPTALSTLTSLDNAAVRLPSLAPPLIKARMLAPVVHPPRHCADVSDIHAVADATLDPIRVDSV